MSRDTRQQDDQLHELARLRARVAQLEESERELINAQEALRQSEERFRIVVEQSGQLVYDYDIRSGKIAWDGAIETITGCTRDEFALVDVVAWEALVHPDDRVMVMQLLERTLRDRSSYRVEYRFRHKSGQYLVVEDNGACVGDGEQGPTRILGTMSDVTQRRAAQQELLEAAERHRAIFEGTSEGIMIADVATTNFIYANPAACRMLGYEEHELQGLPISEIHPPDQYARVRDEFDAQARGDKQLALEIPCRRKDGSVFLADINTASAVIDGRPCNIGFFTDLTPRQRADQERRKLESQVQQTQKLESLGLLAGGVAHDFNNLLLAVLGNAELANRSLASENVARGHLDSIVLAAHRAADLCRQLLAYAGKGRVEVVPIDLNDTILETARLLQVSISKKIKVHYDLARPLPAIYADLGQIRQILMNLVLNASEAIGDRDGTIRVVTAPISWTGGEPGSLRWMPSAPAIGDYVALEVMDDGCGMDSDTVRRIFDPFFTTKFTGRGLGLAAAVGIVRAHHGAMQVRSVPAEGTTFTVMLPAAGGLALQQDTPAAADWTGHGRVLLVDDEDVVLQVGKGMLEHLGFSVVLASTGRKAIEAFRDDPRSFACAILDVMMPEMAGDEALLVLHEIRPDLPVIVVSGYGMEEVSPRFRPGAVAGYLQKPYAIPELQDTLRAVLAEDSAPLKSS